MGQTFSYRSSPQPHKPAPFIAAILLYDSFNDSHKNDQPWIIQNMQKLIQSIEAKVLTSQIQLKVCMISIHKDYYYNVYLNVSTQPDLRQQLKAVLSLSNITLDSLNFSTNLVCQVMETNKIMCEQCYASLERNHAFTEKSQSKGTIGIVYDVYEGPIITVHYTHKCTNENCNSLYSHGRYIINGTHYLEDPNVCDQMNTKATFFRDNILKEYHEYAVKNVGADFYSEIFNEKWKHRIERISDYLKSTGQKLGLRKYDCSMQRHQLSNAFFFRQMHKAVHNDMGKQVVIPFEVIKQYKQMKQQKIILKKNGDTKTLNDSWINCSGYTSIMYSIYGKYLRTASLEWMKYVPVKNGEIHPLHFLTMGDLGAKVTIGICGYPMSWHQKDNEGLSEGNVLFKQTRCIKDPQRGNDDSISFKTCPDHTIRLRDLGCKATKINKLCEYINLKEKNIKFMERATIEQKENESKRTNKIEEELKEYKQEDIDLFTSIEKEVMNNNKKCQRSNYNKTRANMNESMQYINDEQTLSGLEELYQQNNIDPTVLNDRTC